MTVRAWFTISAVAMAVLAAAFVYRFFFATAAPPEVIVTADTGRLSGASTGSCWPQRGDELTCEQRDVKLDAGTTIAREGTLRIIVAFPQQPDRGTLTIVEADTGREVLSRDWTDRLGYELGPGAYRLVAQAQYPADAFVRYVFGFTIR